MNLLIAVVEIEGTTGVIILAMFAIVFVIVAAVAWAILRNVSRTRGAATWRSSTNIPLPVSQATFDQLARVGTKAISRPSLTPDQRQFVTGLATTRRKLATGYRLGLIIAGIGGVGLSIAIYLGYRDDEMILLPVGIIFLVSLGILLSGLIPNRTVDPIEPIDPELFRNVHMNVSTQPLAIQFDDATTQKAIELLKRGVGLESVAREITPGYDGLSEGEQRQVHDAVLLLERSVD